VGFDVAPSADQPGNCATQLILASTFDQSCTQDSDCVSVGEGSVCLPCLFECVRVGRSAWTSPRTPKPT